MTFFKMSFPVWHLPLLELYFCVLYRSSDIPACLLQMEIFLAFKIINSFQQLAFRGSGSERKNEELGNFWEQSMGGGKRKQSHIEHGANLKCKNFQRLSQIFRT